jgi:ABC-type Mn2+/Zn2+ transport system permease subunit
MLPDWLLQPLSYAFMTRGLAAAVLVGVVCAVVGTYVVLRGMAFFGDALAHTVLPGVALGYLVGGGGGGVRGWLGARAPLFWWALGTAVLAALGIGAVSKNARIKEDTAIGIIFAGMFALGIALISTTRSYAVDLSHFLFGDVLGVSAERLGLMAFFGGLVLLLVAAFYKEFMAISFDPVLAVTLRLPVRLLDNLLLAVIAVTVAVSMQIVGVALMVAMLVTPAATAYLLTKRLPAMMAVAALIGAVSAVAGLYLSYYLNVVSGSAIVLTATAVFFLVLLFNPQRGLAWKAWRRA